MHAKTCSLPIGLQNRVSQDLDCSWTRFENSVLCHAREDVTVSVPSLTCCIGSQGCVTLSSTAVKVEAKNCAVNKHNIPILHVVPAYF